ncbi:MAG: TetR/AcrR family transcriptional regulator [Acidimicrobiia bacterium]
MPTQGERRDHTTAAILASAHHLFAKNGFERTSIADVATAAGVTKGSVYHYFDTKEALFQRVFEDLNAALAPPIIEEALREPTPTAALKVGCRLFLEHCLDPAVRQMLLIDGPQVLGWELWREIDARYFLSAMRAGLEGSLADGRDAAVVAHLLVGALDEAVMFVSRAPNASTAVASCASELDRFIDALLA